MLIVFYFTQDTKDTKQRERNPGLVGNLTGYQVIRRKERWQMKSFCRKLGQEDKFHRKLWQNEVVEKINVWHNENESWQENKFHGKYWEDEFVEIKNGWHKENGS